MVRKVCCMVSWVMVEMLKWVYWDMVMAQNKMAIMPRFFARLIKEYLTGERNSFGQTIWDVSEDQQQSQFERRRSPEVHVFEQLKDGSFRIGHTNAEMNPIALPNTADPINMIRKREIPNFKSSQESSCAIFESAISMAVEVRTIETASFSIDSRNHLFIDSAYTSKNQHVQLHIYLNRFMKIVNKRNVLLKLEKLSIWEQDQPLNNSLNDFTLYLPEINAPKAKHCK